MGGRVSGEDDDIWLPLHAPCIVDNRNLKAHLSHCSRCFFF